MPSAAPRARAGPIVLGVILVLTGVFLLREAILAVDAGGVELGGPRLAPIVVSGGLLLIAVMYLVGAVVARGRGRPISGDCAAEDAERPRWTTPAALVAALVCYILVFDRLGFVSATFVFFVVAARILGSRRIVRDVVVAAPLAVVVYLAFTRGLEIHLPGGVLPL